MKRLVLIVAMMFGMVSLASADFNYSNWTWEGHDAGWTVADNGNSVKTTMNSASYSSNSYFISPDNYINMNVKGTFEVQTTNDDDFIGLVFGYNSLTDYVVFDWKQTAQAGASEGFTLARITGDDANLWKHEGNYLEVLGSLYGDGRGWADNTPYNFEAIYTSNNITILIDEIEIFNVDGNFSDGKFGFYYLSQKDAVYTASASAVPIPGAVWLLGSSIGLLAFRKRN